MAVDMFLEIKGVTGESKDKTHAGKIDILSFSLGVSQSASCPNAEAGGVRKCNVQDMTCTKPVDKSSPEIFLRCCTGKHFEEATLIIRKAGDTPLEYETYTMTKVIISSVSKGASSASDGLTEQISMNFAKLKYVYKEQSATGGVESEPEMTFDIAENAAA